MACEIGLKNGMLAIVDDADFNAVSRFRWSAVEGRRGAFYAVRMDYISRRRSGDVPRTVCRQMHRYILDPDMVLPRERFVDHINHDTLDNRRENLRIVDPRISVLNRRMFQSNRYGYRGVVDFRDGKYTVQVLSFGKRYRRYGYESLEDAARVYNWLALLHHGTEAQLNLGPDGMALPPLEPVPRRKGRPRLLTKS